MNQRTLRGEANMDVLVENPLHKGGLDEDVLSLKAKGGYATLLERSQRLMPPVPEVEIAYSEASYVVQIPAKASDVHKIPTVPSVLLDAALAAPRALFRWSQGAAASQSAAPAAKATQDFIVLDKVSGVIKPGKLTLIIAPPGHGKSSMLKLLSDRLPADGRRGGAVTYSGLTPTQAAGKGISLRSLLGMADQLDLHTPQLTVRETLSFAAYNSHVSESYLPPELRPLAQGRVDTMLKLLGLEECKDTFVGSDILRGISGGQKKRVTVAEVLLSPARALLLDEVTSGLDSSVSYELITNIRAWAGTTRGTVVAALQQPTPELVALFDDFILLREGCVVYHGSREGVLPYLAALGHVPPPGVDLADWIVEMLNDPVKSAEGTTKRQKEGGGKESVSSPAVDTPSLVSAWLSHPAYSQLMASASHPVTAGQEQGQGPSNSALELTSPYAKAQYGRPYARSMLQHFGSLLGRQVRLNMRDSNTIFAKVLQGIIMGLVLGSLFWQLDAGPTGAFLKLSLLLFGIINVAFSNFTEIPLAFATRQVMYKEIDAGRYPTLAFLVSQVVAAIPLAAVESVLFGIILYKMAGFSEDAGRTIYFLFLLFLVSIALAGYFRLVAYTAPTLETSNTATGPVVSIMVVFSGYLITRDKIPRWLLGAFYLSPFSWALTAMAQNEFTSDTYKAKPDPTRPDTTIGTIYLQSYEFDTNPAYLWAAIGYLLLIFLCFNACGGAAMKKVRYEKNIGTSRISAVEEVEEGEGSVTPPALPADATVVATTVPTVNPAPGDSTAHSSHGSHSHSHGLHALPFSPVTVTFQDMRYEVQLPRKLGGGRRALLRGVTGYAKPGSMTALMGASGAGKTTLLDCLAGRKNAGWLTGTILLNGQVVDKATFSRLSCYVEQADLHLAYATVRESLEFAAKLRLPSSVTAAQRSTFVTEVLDILEMTDLADRLVGDEDSSTGLSPSQRKRLTIGVELVSNAPILFLDEPTTGLDSRAAAVVMRVIRRIAHAGRTVICTIHQPSEALFLMFDELLLLTKGGYEVYCGPLGPGRASALVSYLHSLPGVPACPPDMNPAGWMLDVLAGVTSAGTVVPESAPASSAGGVHRVKTEAVLSEEPSTPSAPALPAVGTGTSEGGEGRAIMDFCEAYHASDLYKQVQEVVARLSTPDPSANKPVAVTSTYSRSWLVQLEANLHRTWLAYARNIPYNLTRIVALTILALLFGTIYYRIEANTIGGITSKISVMFLCVAFSGVMNFGTVLGVVAKQRAAFYRERSSHTHAPEPYSISLAIVELPWIVIQSLIFCAIIYFMAGFDAVGEKWVHFFLSFALCALSYNIQGQLFAAAFPNVIVAQAVGGLTTTLSFLFAGLFSPAPSIPAGWKWAWFINPITYALEGITMMQFYCAGGSAAGCPSITVVTPEAGPVAFDVSTYVGEYFGMQNADRWLDVGILAIFVGIFIVLNLVAVRFISHVTR